jgi:TonB family protein
MRLYWLAVLSATCAVALPAPVLAQDGWDGLFDTGAPRKPAAPVEREPLPTLTLAEQVAAPAYPVEAVQQGREGAVAINLSVTGDGKVIARAAKVAESSGFPDLDRQALLWATQLRFRPMDIPDAARKAAGQYLRVTFSLKGGQPQVSATSVALVPPAIDPARPIMMPPYPMDARDEGTTVLQFRVRADGFVDPPSITILASSGSKRLDDAAIAQAATSWRFLPATDNGRPVASWHIYSCPFKRPNR